MNQSDKQAERRRGQRIALLLHATARELGRSKVPVRIIDISSQGCRLEVLSGVFAGKVLWVSIPGLENQEARVVWQGDGFAGVEFTSPLSQSVFDSVVSAHRSACKSFIGDLRELAKRTRRAAMHSFDDATARALQELSHDCSVQALLDGFTLIEAKPSVAVVPQLSGTMLRRRLPVEQVKPGFSFNW